ncbi:MAG: DEAD/DEAH box helicase [Clostridiales bacterium GWF2_38_85]|nr:MAG: DEAD/DEAH box helicase [Clostridiales bacterium GWF2_38_85]HBL85196.1 DEAD/DEAH box helicase [Clostridiales bacterium]
MHFKDLKIIYPILKALEREKYTSPTPIQEQAIIPILEGRDLLGCAQTGTGKTAAFAVPIIQLLSEKPLNADGRQIKSLILTPTRELAIQIFDSFRTYGQFTGLRYGVIFGGVSQKPQEQVLKNGIDVLVATPGRLIDLIKQKLVDLSFVEIFVLDEADHMLDLGFINDVKIIISKLLGKKQTLLFSATMPVEITQMADSVLVDPVKISVTPNTPVVSVIKQNVYLVDKKNKPNLLLHVLNTLPVTSALVFTRTKHGADRVVKELYEANFKAIAIHGNKSQNARQAALESFRNKESQILVATDIAARGIDIDELSHVINYEIPNIPETYIHRIGRTGRAGLGGVAISFCDIDEKPFLASIEKLLGKHIHVVINNPYPMQVFTLTEKTAKSNQRPTRSAVNAPKRTKETYEAKAQKRQANRKRQSINKNNQTVRVKTPSFRKV